MTSASRLEERQGEWSEIHALRKRQHRRKQEVGGSCGKAPEYMLLFSGEKALCWFTLRHTFTCTHTHSTITNTDSTLTTHTCT